MCFRVTGVLDSPGGSHRGEDTCYVGSNRGRSQLYHRRSQEIKKKGTAGGKVLDMNIDSCILSNSAAGQRSSTAFMS